MQFFQIEYALKLSIYTVEQLSMRMHFFGIRKFSSRTHKDEPVAFDSFENETDY